jgi:glycolate oxidase
MADSLPIHQYIHQIKQIIGDDGVIDDPVELLSYESDALQGVRSEPYAVIFPRTTEEVAAVVKILHKAGIPFVPRGAGTGLSCGCLPIGGGVVISLIRMNRILEIDVKNRYAVVEPGVINQWITDAVKSAALCFAPDPSSGNACTIGGNVAENAGGPHTLKYGVTSNHILGLEMVLPDGEIVTIGGKTSETPGYDLVGIVTGSEGTFAIITKIIVKLVRLPETYVTFCAVFDSIDDAARSITGLFSAGIMPAALEMIDRVFMKALNQAFDMHFPEDADALLIIELDGQLSGMKTLKQRVIDAVHTYNVRSIETAVSDEERTRLWKARKLAFGAVGRISPCYFTQDGVVPRTKLPEIMRIIYDIGKKYNISIAMSFHAGDGNIHPCIPYDDRVPGAMENAIKAGTEILKACVDLGGSISGEHGIGAEKNNFMIWIYTDDDLACMMNLKKAFNPDGLLNPHKIFPETVQLKI